MVWKASLEFYKMCDEPIEHEGQALVLWICKGICVARKRHYELNQNRILKQSSRLPQTPPSVPLFPLSLSLSALESLITQPNPTPPKNPPLTSQIYHEEHTPQDPEYTPPQ